MITEYVINNRDNTIDLLFKANSIVQALNSVTKVELVDEDGNVDTISSADHPSWFDWDTGTIGKMIVSLGAAELTAGKYIFKVVLYDASNTNGIEWDKIFVEVCD